MNKILLLEGDTLLSITTLFVAIVTFFLVLATIYVAKQRDKVSEIERFESQFFEMLKLYRENVIDMKYIEPKMASTKEKEIINGLVENKIVETKNEIESRMVFVKINREFLRLFSHLKYKFRKSYNIEKIEFDLIAITWLTIFFGLGNEGKLMLQKEFRNNELNNKYADITNYIITVLRLKKSEYNDNILYYGGHQIRLGHYFRHLWQTVDFVNSQDFLSRHQKYVYVKMLRSQFSTFEQAIIFYNSLSPLGAIWEFSKRDIGNNPREIKYNDNDLFSPKNKLLFLPFGIVLAFTKRDIIRYNDDDLYITRYKLIKNIPEGFCNSISPKRYYKRIEFEYEKRVRL